MRNLLATTSILALALAGGFPLSAWSQQLLVVGGGGGGAGFSSANGGAGQAGTAGQDGSGPSAGLGGTNGQGGGGGTESFGYNGGGGAGWLGNGGNGIGAGPTPTAGGSGNGGASAPSFAGGAGGGQQDGAGAPSAGLVGGFGGGGGGGWDSGGGGGGYSGGGGGDGGGSYAGGGGGSFVGSQAQTPGTTSGANGSSTSRADGANGTVQIGGVALTYTGNPIYYTIPTTGDYLIDVMGAQGGGASGGIGGYGADARGTFLFGAGTNLEIIVGGGGISGAFGSGWGGSGGGGSFVLELSTNIDTVQPSYLASGLGSSVNPVFQGGTLVLDQPGGMYAQNFTLDGSGTNTINQAGNTATFGGVFSDAVSGTPGSLVIANTGNGGSAILTGANTYTGTTTINKNATLALAGAGSIASSEGIIDNGTFDVSAATSTPAIRTLSGNGIVALGARPLTLTAANGIFTGGITGTGALNVTGGSETLDGNSGGFGGTTTVGSAILEVGDAGHAGAVLGGNVAVSSGGTLMGHGTIGGTVSNDGNLHPGGSIGVLTVSGNYTQSSAGTLTIEITPNVSQGPGVGYDQLVVDGKANLAGTLAVLDDAGTYTVGSRYTILTAAAGRSGTFATVSFAPQFAGYINPVVSYDANDVYLTLDPTAAAINGAQQVPDMLTALASTAEGVGSAVLDRVCSPEARRNSVPGRGCVVHALAAGYRSELWIRGIGGLGNLTGGGSRFGFNDSYGGVLLGGGIGRGGFTIGASGGYVATALHFSDASAASQNAGVGFVYGRYQRGPLRVGAVAAYGGGEVDGARELTGTGMTAKGNRPGEFAIVQGRAAYDVTLGSVTVEPRVSLSYIHAGQSGFGESGAGLLDLIYAGTSTDEVNGRLTARVMRSFVVGRWSVAPWAEAGVRETFSGLSRTVVATIGTFNPGVSGVSPAPTAGVVGAGMDAAATSRMDLFLRYQGLFSANQTENAFSAGLTMRF